jgi:hypothetical protein
MHCRLWEGDSEYTTLSIRTFLGAGRYQVGHCLGAHGHDSTQKHSKESKTLAARAIDCVLARLKSSADLSLARNFNTLVRQACIILVG